MRSLALFVAMSLLAVSAAPLANRPAAAQLPLAELSVAIEGTMIDGRTVFNASTILIPQVPINLTITFINTDPDAGMIHTLTINDADSVIRVDSGNLLPGQSAVLNMTIHSMTNVTFNGFSFEPEQGTRGILFYCIPHRPAGMIGQIVLASASEPVPEAPEKGINIRAYWIGMIGIVAMLAWIGISYFVIRSSTPRFRDHKEHVRRGLP
ncbi:MAG: hypothetical protein A3K59_01400 [Euryarchaeota archaeon RBG_19FT_COMBO_69_17]|nr:MAG: hypothetical protein A3K59_01400 [Euryarchaeota archaeon RBG_19FT_COMBO_69_17]